MPPTEIPTILLVSGISFALGALPLIRWITLGLAGRQLDRLGTGNVSVSAAFYHGGKVAGILAVSSEAFKGIAAVLLARFLLPGDAVWEVVALIALVLGRYTIARGAGTTNVTWGYFTHDWVAAGLVLLISGISFTILREKKSGRLGVLVLLPIVAALLHPQDGIRVGAIALLCLLMAWIYEQIPDDLDLPSGAAHGEAQPMFRFFRGDRAVLSFDQVLTAEKVGQKAATLSQLRQWGYPVPMGWVLPPGDDPAPLIELLQPSAEQPLVVRSSAIGEDSEAASAAGQYESILNVTSQPALEQAILRCQASYNRPEAVQYRRDRQIRDEAMGVLVQQQVRGVFSGVAFSRDPIARQGEAVVIEALPGAASQIVSGQVTPEQYRVWIRETDLRPDWLLPNDLHLELEGEGDVPPHLIRQVAYLARHLESRYHGIPQDIEWSYDGQQLWLLQSRPITTLLPVWTRKIAAEVIPGFIRPLTWSINQPLTCGVWGEIFSIVLGDRAHGLDFTETATLHNSSAYFNASLLGQIFLRMGLPPESLEFLTRGAKFSKPPFASTLKNIPGLLRLAQREFQLVKDFQQDNQLFFEPGFASLAQQPVDRLSPEELLSRIEQTLDLLRRATYYSIMAPLSAALRQAILKPDDSALDNGQAPEVASLRSLQSLAAQTRSQLQAQWSSTGELFAKLRHYPDLLQQFDQFLDRYGYLSEVGTDIAVPTWREDPHPVQELLAQLVQSPTPVETPGVRSSQWKVKQVQQRLTLKGQVTETYSRLLAELRWSFVALEQRWLESGLLSQPGDIFFLKHEEVRRLIASDATLKSRVSLLVEERRSQFAKDSQVNPVPTLVYGNEPPLLHGSSVSTRQASGTLQGIGASPGRVEGQVIVLKNLQNLPAIDRNIILVVPYTDSGWSVLLARAGGLIAEVGGRLSHGAIIAREYGIPAVMNIPNATQQFRDGQQVRIDGQQGTVEILSTDEHR